MLIRKIIAADNEVLAIIIRDALCEFKAAKPGTVYFDETTDNLSNLFADKRSAYFVLEIDGNVAGGAGIFPTTGLPPDTCELVKMYLAKEYRGKGYGQILVTKCIEAAKELGYSKMYLETMKELATAITMYNKNGFININAPMGNSGHTGCDLWMIKNLAE